MEKASHSMVVLNNGRCVPPEFLSAIRIAVEEGILWLAVDSVFTLRQICGEGYWEMLDDGEKRRAGWCMEHMVAKNELPFKVAESLHEYPKRYQLV